MSDRITHAAEVAHALAAVFEKEEPDAQTSILALGMVAAAVASQSSKPALMLGLIAQQIEKYRSHGNFPDGQN